MREGTLRDRAWTTDEHCAQTYLGAFRPFKDVFEPDFGFLGFFPARVPAPSLDDAFASAAMTPTVHASPLCSSDKKKSTLLVYSAPKTLDTRATTRRPFLSTRSDVAIPRQPTRAPRVSTVRARRTPTR